MSYRMICPAVATVCVGLLAATSLAQSRPTGKAPANSLVRIRKLEGTGTRTRVRTPFYNTDQDRGTARSREWYRLILYYDTAPEWIDTITIQFHVMASQRTRQGEAFSIYRKTVRYADIQAGRNHRAEVFLRPQALERYGEVVAAAVELIIENDQGQRITLTESDTSTKLPEAWWKNPVVTESPTVKVRDGYLLDRNQSPWALINIDDYEVIK